MRPGFFVSCSPAKIARRASMDPKGQGVFVLCKLPSCSGVRHNSPTSPRKENKRATAMGRFAAIRGVRGTRWMERDAGTANGSRAFKDDTLQGRALQLQTTDLECHGVYRHVPSTTYHARRCHVVPLATAAYEINWTVPQISGMWLEIHLAATLRQTLFSIFSGRLKKGSWLLFSQWHKQPMSPRCLVVSLFFSSLTTETCGRQDMDHLAVKAALHALRDTAHSPFT